MKITENEMRGLLAGKCLPSDILVGENLAAYLVRKFAALQQKLDALSEFRSMIFGALGVHDSHEDFVARVNIENALRRANCLSAIERHFTFEVEDEEYEGEMMEQCPLNWGQEPESYIETFKSVLNSVRAEGVEMFAKNLESLQCHMEAKWARSFISEVLNVKNS
ncbi:hypothetical protein [Pantoea piersonii]|uniref:hypothetical protein n=1 Tax=Pantoea piersonii TaxID=2364647 RepID=UPI00289DB508|nr:hypothetical protein [Pantoea piersonii]